MTKSLLQNVADKTGKGVWTRESRTPHPYMLSCHVCGHGLPVFAADRGSSLILNV